MIWLATVTRRYGLLLQTEKKLPSLSTRSSGLKLWNWNLWCCYFNSFVISGNLRYFPVSGRRGWSLRFRRGAFDLNASIGVLPLLRAWNASRSTLKAWSIGNSDISVPHPPVQNISLWIVGYVEFRSPTWTYCSVLMLFLFYANALCAHFSMFN